jgi:hypothetical protein
MKNAKFINQHSNLAGRLGAAPSQQSFGDSAARLVPGLIK